MTFYRRFLIIIHDGYNGSKQWSFLDLQECGYSSCEEETGLSADLVDNKGCGCLEALLRLLTTLCVEREGRRKGEGECGKGGNGSER